ncbi:hypothetical protein D3C73_1273820 [compost metagenome]
MAPTQHVAHFLAGREPHGPDGFHYLVTAKRRTAADALLAYGDFRIITQRALQHLAYQRLTASAGP